MQSIPIIGVNTENNQTVFFESIRQFARFVNANQTKRCTAQRRVASGGGMVETRHATWYIERV